MEAERWTDLAPSTHPFEASRVEQLVRAILASGDPGNHRAFVHAISNALAREFGEWSRDWNWNAGPRPEDEPEHTIRRIVEAVAEWRSYLELLEATFAELRAGAAELTLERDVEHAGARLLPIVLERTHGEDAWYSTFAATLSWYLEDRVYDVEHVREVVDDAICGRFESWVAPTDEQARSTFVAVGQEVATVERGAPHDAIAEWTAIRGRAFVGRELVIGHSGDGDGHVRFIDTVDRARDPERADRLAAALLLARDSATRGVRLGLDQLAEWQAIVLGRSVPVELRTVTAYGKRGREVYTGFERAAFEVVLDDVNDTVAHVAVRAARVYLDICFFHPFDDGNGRAARLALDYVLHGAGLALRDAGPLFTLARAANDARGAASFAAMIARLAFCPVG